MSVQTQINRINTAKSSIANAITAKGVTVPAGTSIDGMAALIGSIPSGSPCASGTFTVSTAGPYTVSGLSFTPKIVAIFRSASVSKSHTITCGYADDVNSIYCSNMSWNGTSTSQSYGTGKTITMTSDGFTVGYNVSTSYSNPYGTYYWVALG